MVGLLSNIISLLLIGSVKYQSSLINSVFQILELISNQEETDTRVILLLY